MERQKTAVYLNICTVAGLIAMALFIWYGIRTGIFVSAEALENFLGRFGLWAPVFFVLILIFGPVWGFVYNYVGISLGSVLAFLLSKRYGKPFVQNMIGEKNYEKYIGWLDKGKAFDKAFAAAIFLPVAPDDLLCYIAGLTKMTLKKFTLIIVLGKPGSIFLYSLGLTGITQLIRYLF